MSKGWSRDSIIVDKLRHPKTLQQLHTVLNFLNFTSSLLKLFFIQPLSGNCYKLQSVVTFTCIQTFDQNFVFFTERRHIDRQWDCETCNFQNLHYFRFLVWKTKSCQKSKPIQKLKHTNSILEYFEYFCQISSKLIIINLRHTVSKFVRFFETQCTSTNV